MWDVQLSRFITPSFEAGLDPLSRATMYFSDVVTMPQCGMFS